MFSALPTSSQGRSLLVLRSPLAESDLSYLSFEVTVLSEVYEVRVDKPQKSGPIKSLQECLIQILVRHCGIGQEAVDLCILVNTETNEPVLSDRDLELSAGNTPFFLALLQQLCNGDEDDEQGSPLFSKDLFTREPFAHQMTRASSPTHYQNGSIRLLRFQKPGATFHCPFVHCAAPFHSDQTLRSHFRRHLTEDTEQLTYFEEAKDCSSPLESPRLSCNMCPRQYSTPQELREHSRLKHDSSSYSQNEDGSCSSSQLSFIQDIYSGVAQIKKNFFQKAQAQTTNNKMALEWARQRVLEAYLSTCCLLNI